jgi:hypothetical protein
MEEELLKINKQCFQNLIDINNALSSVETKGDSTIVIYKIRVTLMAVLEQMQKDNQSKETQEQQKEQGAIIDNTKKKEG